MAKIVYYAIFASLLPSLFAFFVERENGEVIQFFEIMGKSFAVLVIAVGCGETEDFQLFPNPAVWDTPVFCADVDNILAAEFSADKKCFDV